MLRPQSARPSASPLPRLSLICLGLLAAGLTQAQGLDEQGLSLRPIRQLLPVARGLTRPAMVLSARQLSSHISQTSVAEGAAELRYGELLLSSDRISYDQVQDLARAQGQVELRHQGSLVRGPSLQLFVQRFEGEMLDPSYFFSQTGGSGHAKRIQFLDAQRVRAEAATYSSCPADESGQARAWELSMDSLSMDFENNEGLAKGAVLRFYGVPILAAPALSFPVGDQRKSGWLPPDINLDNRSGLELGLPYYWNIAPQRDATFLPFVMTRRGPGVDSEFRYLEPSHGGSINFAWLPHDREAGRQRWDLRLAGEGQLGAGLQFRLSSERVSDDEYWKDLPRRVNSLTKRLLATDLQLQRDFAYGWGEGQAYARVQRWQPLQGLDTLTRFEAPYQRSPQIGVRLNSQADDLVLAGYLPWGRRARLEGGLELEYNRFDLPAQALASQSQQTGERAHLLAHLSLPLGTAAWWLIPRLSLNAASYRVDQPLSNGARSIGRSIPTFSIDHGWVFERPTQLFGRSLTQTLEPRALYVNTPYRDQTAVPNFDAAAKDFNFDSIYAENPFSGVDRVADARQLTLGATSRWVDTGQGEELLRLGLVQRFLFRDQRITADGGEPAGQRFSDVLLLGSAHLSRAWWLDAAMQFNADNGRAVRSVLRTRYSPGPFRTLSAAYRLVSGQSEQIELGWQWPLWGTADAGRARSASSCQGAWYSAGRVQYSMRDKRLTDSVVGVEYDAGCWILRAGVERLSTGFAETNTRLMLQIELVGLSQLGSNALKVLRDNIPGYRPLSSDKLGRLEASYD